VFIRGQKAIQTLGTITKETANETKIIMLPNPWFTHHLNTLVSRSLSYNRSCWRIEVRPVL